jgi:predicted permease
VPRWDRELRARLAQLHLTPAREAEIVEELSQHFDDRYEELRATGVGDADARRLVIDELDSDGGLAQRIGTLSQAHNAPPVVPGNARPVWLEGLWEDLRHTSHAVRTQPGFAAAIVITLALGMAVNTTVFSVVNGAVFRPLPFAEGDRIVQLNVMNVAKRQDGELSYLEFRDWQHAQTTLEQAVGTNERSVDISGDGRPAARVPAAFVSWSTFSMLGQQPALGRDFRDADDRDHASPVVIIGWSLWNARYHAERTIVGRTIRVNGVPSTVVGVMPRDFGFPYSAQFWLPLAALPEADRTSRAARVLDGFGRLRPGVTIEQATADLAEVATSLAGHYPDTNRDIAPLVTPFGRAPVFVGVMLALLGAVGFVLLIACANVTNLLLARVSERSRDVAVRIALGASRWRIVRQLIVESLTLAAAGGVCGVALSYPASALFTRAIAERTPSWMRFPIDRVVLTYVVVLCVGSAVVFSLAPAWNMSRTHLATSLRDDWRTSRSSRQRLRWTGGFVVAQVALALVLLTAAMLMMRNLVGLMRLDIGVESTGLAQIPLNLQPGDDTPEQRRLFFAQLEERLASSADVNAALATEAPLNGARLRRVRIDGQPGPERSDPSFVGVVGVGDRYFDVVGTPVVAGRTFTSTEIHQADATVVVNERFARMYFKDGLAVGGHISLVEPNVIDDASESGSSGPRWMTIVGVVGNVRQAWPPRREFDPVVYSSYAEDPPHRIEVLARSARGPDHATVIIGDHVRTLDPDIPVLPATTVEQMLDRRLLLHRLFGSMFTSFASIAVLLAAGGLYAVTAYAVSRRTREIGVRLALGADARRVWSTVMATTLWQLGVGLALGLVGAIGVARILPGILIGPDGAHPIVLIGVVVFLIAVGLVATAASARRATRVDARVILQTE